MTVRELDSNVRSKIESGLIITDATQCVLELVENSLDAKATTIAVRLNFVNYTIEVVDNGEGISPDDIHLIGKRYMTSKSQDVDDFKIGLLTYGYRGQVIRSILDVCAKLILKTKSRKSQNVFVKIFKNGKHKSTLTCANKKAETGTTVKVYDFMCTMPVRRLRMSELFDVQGIKSQLEYLAVIHNEVSFILRDENKGEIVLRTHRHLNPGLSFCKLFGISIYEFLVPFHSSYEKLEVQGFISLKRHDKNDLQLFYVNKRIVYGSIIHKMVNHLIDKYFQKNTHLHGESPIHYGINFDLPKNIHNVYVIQIQCPYSYFDMYKNLRKTVVEFNNWDAVLNCIKNAIKTALCIKESDSSSDVINADKRQEIKNFYKMQNAREHLRHGLQGKSIKRNIMQDCSLSSKNLKSVKSLNEKYEKDHNINCGDDEISMIGSNEINMQNTDVLTKELFTSPISKNDSVYNNLNQCDILRLSTEKETSESHEFLLNFAIWLKSKIKSNVTIYELYKEFIGNKYNFKSQNDSRFLEEKPFSGKRKMGKKKIFEEEKRKRVDFKTNVALKEGVSAVEVESNSFEESEKCNMKDSKRKALNYSKCHLKQSNNHNGGASIEDNNLNKKRKKNALSLKNNRSHIEKCTKGCPRFVEKNNSSFSSYFFSSEETILPQTKVIKYDKLLPWSGSCSPQNYFNAYKNFKSKIQLKKKKNCNFESANLIKHKNEIKYLKSADKTVVENASFLDINKDIGIQTGISSNLIDKNIQVKLDENQSANSKNFEEVNDKTFKDKDPNSPSSRKGPNIHYDIVGEQVKTIRENRLMTEIGKDLSSLNKNPSNVTPRITSAPTFSTGIAVYGSRKTTKDTSVDYVNTHFDENSNFKSIDNELVNKNQNTGSLSNNTQIQENNLNSPNVCGGILMTRGLPNSTNNFFMTERYIFLPKGLSQSPFVSNPESIFKRKEDIVNSIQGVCNDQGRNLLKDDLSNSLVPDTIIRELKSKAEENMIYYEKELIKPTPIRYASKFNILMNSCNINKDILSDMRVVGQFDKKFILAMIYFTCLPEKKMLAVLDQHAVGERIQLERLLTEFRSHDGKFLSIRCDPPIQCVLDESVVRVIPSLRGKLHNYGIEISVVDRQTVSVSEIPLCLSKNYVTEKVENIIKNLLDNAVSEFEITRGSISIVPKVLYDVIALRACKSAVKFNEVLSEQQMKKMISDLVQCQFPFQCAHGRPSILPILEFDNFNGRISK